MTRARRGKNFPLALVMGPGHAVGGGRAPCRGKNITLALVMGPGHAVGGGRAPCRGKNIALALVMALAAAGCAGGSSTDGETAAGDRILQFEGGSDEDRGIGRPVVQVHSDGGSPAFLDAAADPSTDLGRLRAQHLPVWTSDFDWAFPPGRATQPGNSTASPSRRWAPTSRCWATSPPRPR